MLFRSKYGAEICRLWVASTDYTSELRIGPSIIARVVDSYRRWIAEGCNASMAYLENYPDKRFDPRLLVPGVRSIVSVALNYAPSRRMPTDAPQFASYALGKDYHDVVKHKLSQLAERLGFELSDQVRAFCDSAPVLERYWAVRAGLGWIGRNHQLIIPHAGSMFFLGELFLPVEVDYDKPMESRCGTCNHCVEACPTQALKRNADGDTCKFDSRLCLNYQTIENRGEIPDELAPKMTAPRTSHSRTASSAATSRSRRSTTLRICATTWLPTCRRSA